MFLLDLLLFTVDGLAGLQELLPELFTVGGCDGIVAEGRHILSFWTLNDLTNGYTYATDFAGIIPNMYDLVDDNPGTESGRGRGETSYYQTTCRVERVS